MTVGTRFPLEAARFPEVQSVVTVLEELLAEGLRGVDLQDATIESVTYCMVANRIQTSQRYL